MTLTKKGREKYYGDEQSDIREYLTEYSKANDYVASHFADAVCKCGGHEFRVPLNDEEGVATRICTSCGHEHPIGDSTDYMEDAELEECACPCGGEVFEVTVGVSLYQDSEDVRWLYVGLRCLKCKRTACYGHWKNEFIGYRELLQMV
jgi:Zn ribbon nucleic-acid-binding protein